MFFDSDKLGINEININICLKDALFRHLLICKKGQKKA